MKDNDSPKNSTSNVQLSKGILEMKFMKKSKEKAQKKLEAGESRDMYSKEITDEMRKAGNIVFIETSIFNCKDMIDGRLSFGGMNPDIEKMMSKEYSPMLAKLERDKEKDISDVEMVANYSTLTKTIEKKFKKPKKKFMKPSDSLLY